MTGPRRKYIRDGTMAGRAPALPEQGEKFGLWAFLSAESPTRWHAVCVCGVERTVRAQDLRRGRSASCGCRGSGFHPTTAGGVKRTLHGKDHGDKVYRAWRNAKNRVSNPRAQKYRTYGARGVTMCDEWFHSFEAFYAHVGEPPSTLHSLDRIDNEKGYEPGNVRWATAREQGLNRRTTIQLTVRGVTKPLVAWCEETGMNPATAGARFRRGWPAEAVINPNTHKPKECAPHARPK